MTEYRLNTAVTSLFGIKHPILLAGMNVAAGPELAAAVTNAGGLGVIGGVGYTPKFLKLQIANLKASRRGAAPALPVDVGPVHAFSPFTGREGVVCGGWLFVVVFFLLTFYL
jgi:hypothetical protein